MGEAADRIGATIRRRREGERKRCRLRDEVEMSGDQSDPSRDGDTPSDPKELIDMIVETLKIDPAFQQEWREQIAFNIAAAKDLISFDSRTPKPGDMKRKAAKLRAALANAQRLSREIEPLLSAVLFELADGAISRNYEAFNARVEDAIHATTMIEKKIVIPPGAQPRDPAKFAAKRIALELVGEFDDTKKKSLVNNIASLLYELLTGRAHVDVPEPLDAYAQAILKMRGPLVKKPTIRN